jgi:predicted nuclease of predicted toxin-antitoxin system
MKLLADENIEGATVRWLREMGHDVCWAAEDLAGLPDSELHAIADASERILLTRDRDFGYLVFRERLNTRGVVLLRLRAKNQWKRLALLQKHWAEIDASASSHFVIVMNDRVRRRELTRSES